MIHITPGCEAIFRANWADPKVSAKEAGDVLGLSSSGAFGLARRLGLGQKATRGDPWAEERVVELRALIAQRLTAAEIARRMGMGKGAICGKATRLGLKILGGPQPPSAHQIAQRAAAQANRDARALAIRERKRISAPNTGGARKVAAIRNGRAKPALRVICGGSGVIERSPDRSPNYRSKADAFAPLPGVQPIPWTSRAFGQCAWPIDVPGESEQHSCAAACGADDYCSAHREIRRDNTKPAPKAHELARSLRRYA